MNSQPALEQSRPHTPTAHRPRSIYEADDVAARLERAVSGIGIALHCSSTRLRDSAPEIRIWADIDAMEKLAAFIEEQQR